MSSSAAEGRSGRNEIQLALFRVGTVCYAVDILRIKEVIRPQRLTSMPDAPIFVEGVLNLRGTVIPVIDLRKRFSVEADKDNPRSRIIIVAHRQRLTGLIVDEVLEVCRFTRQDLQLPPRMDHGAEAAAICAVGRRGDDIVMILDLERVLPATEPVYAGTPG